MITVFDCFAGYGGAEFAMQKAGFEIGLDFDVVGFSEIDKFAIKCFQQNHGGHNFGDITKIDWKIVPNFDLLTGGFPCQDISQAGKQDLTKGRSNLVFELTKALRLKQPKYFLFENVAAIQQEKFKSFLRQAENEMKKAGYQVFRICINSKDYGIPQSRQRVWFIGFRNDLRKPFGWNPYPNPIGNNLKLKDILEKEADKKYYLSEKALAFIKRNDCKIVDENENIFPCLNGLEHLTNKQMAFLSCSIRTRTYKGQPAQIEIRKDGIANQIPTVTKDSLILETFTKIIRRLTPKECFRLQGFLKDEINLEGISDSQKYKLAGNGWEINVVSLIFKKMFGEK